MKLKKLVLVSFFLSLSNSVFAQQVLDLKKFISDERIDIIELHLSKEINTIIEDSESEEDVDSGETELRKETSLGVLKTTIENGYPFVNYEINLKKLVNDNKINLFALPVTIFSVNDGSCTYAAEITNSGDLKIYLDPLLTSDETSDENVSCLERLIRDLRSKDLQTIAYDRSKLTIIGESQSDNVSVTNVNRTIATDSKNTGVSKTQNSGLVKQN